MFIAKALYSDDGLAQALGKLGRALVEKDMVKLQNLCAEYFNPHYETWNAMYDSNPVGTYEDFIREKQLEVIKNTPAFKTLFALDPTIGADCQAVGKVKPVIAFMFNNPKLVHLLVTIAIEELP